jgi:phosphoribosylaminoimidazole-succinocarboxamide synthase
MENPDTSLSKYNLAFKGKVRNIYNYDDNKLLIYTSDRISAFDYVFNDEVKGKGLLLTKMAKFWFNKTRHIVSNHIANEDLDLPSNVRDNCMLVTKTKVLPIEAIVRGHLAGSAWNTYEATQKINGIPVTKEYKRYDKFDAPIFTPSTKAKLGDKDINIGMKEMQNLIGKELTNSIQKISIELFEFAYNFAKEKGVIIADTKFEFGLDSNNKLILIDEIFTPDCSRFWLYDKKLKKLNYDAFDKQFFRDYLIQNNWDNEQIIIPSNVKEKIISKYKTAYDLITNEI